MAAGTGLLFSAPVFSALLVGSNGSHSHRHGTARMGNDPGGSALDRTARPTGSTAPAHRPVI